MSFCPPLKIYLDVILLVCAVSPTDAANKDVENCWSGVPVVSLSASIIELTENTSEICNDCVPENGATTNCPFVRRKSELSKISTLSAVFAIFEPEFGTVAFIKVFVSLSFFEILPFCLGHIE